MTPLHRLGDAVRALLVGVPLPAAKTLFLALPALLLVWVILRKPDADDPPGRARAVRVWAAVALALQCLVYLLL
jgi:hypothetical protein